MPYSDHFKLADDFVVHLDAVFGTIRDPFIQSRYVGFVAVSSVTEYELAVKDILCSFADQKHRVLGVFAKNFFERLNGRIKAKQLREEYAARFGEKYKAQFEKKLKGKEDELLRLHRVSMLSCYANIINWRNEFAHEGRIPATVTYDEKKII